MTCIVAVADLDHRVTFVGGDKQVSMGRNLCTTLPAHFGKVFKRGSLAAGVCGAVRLGNILYALFRGDHLSSINGPMNLEDILINKFIPPLMELAKSRETLTYKEGLPSIDGEILVAYGEQICFVGNDLAVTPIGRGYWAIGSGAPLALGCLYGDEYGSPMSRIEKALAAAAMFDVSVGPKTVVLETDPIGLISGRYGGVAGNSLV